MLLKAQVSENEPMASLSPVYYVLNGVFNARVARDPLD